jgi:hypothetical protein
MHNEEIHNYFTLNIVRMVKLRMTWTGYAARIGLEMLKSFCKKP